MTTTRSLYTFKQFEQVFQKLAHKVAIEAVTDLKAVRLTIKTFSSGQLSEVSTKDYHIRFYLRHLSFTYKPEGSYDHPDHLSVDIEEKFYSTSRDCTKISFYSPEIKNEDIKDEWGFAYLVDHEKTDAEKKRRQKKINEFLEKLMKEAGLKPEPRFSLQEYSKN